MRVIGGKAKGTKLVSLRGARLRPTLDRVRESFFNQVSGLVEGAWFLDLFAGSGAMGIEALSRGAEHVVFVDPDVHAKEIVYRNLDKCRMFPADKEATPKNWVFLKMSAHRAIPILDERGYRFDIVYVDPPFSANLYAEALNELARSALLKETALVAVEHSRKTSLAENYGRLHRTKTRKLGDNVLSFYELE